MLHVGVNFVNNGGFLMKYEVKVAILAALGVVIGTLFVLWATGESVGSEVERPMTILLLEKSI